MAKAKKPKNHYGHGSIFYIDSKKKWMGQLDLGKDENSKRIRKTVLGDSPEEVEEKMQKVKFDVYSGKFVDASTVTFKQLMMQMLNEKRAMNEIQEQTYFRHIETLKQCAPINDIPIQKVDTTMLKELVLSKVDYSQSYIRKIHMMLNQGFAEAVRRKIIVENPMVDVRRPKSSKKPRKIRAMTMEEQKEFLEILKTKRVLYADQMLISMFTGMRMGEIDALSVKDINLNFNFINIDKTIAKGERNDAFLNTSPKTEKGNRQVPINSMVKPVIDRVLKTYVPTKDGMLFHSSAGKLIPTTLVNAEFKRILKVYNIKDDSVRGDLTLHSLRHTYATRCIESGMPPKVLQNLLGHTDIKVTLDTYSDVFDNFQNENVAKVDEYLSSAGLALNA